MNPELPIILVIYLKKRHFLLLRILHANYCDELWVSESQEFSQLIYRVAPCNTCKLKILQPKDYYHIE